MTTLRATDKSPKIRLSAWPTLIFFLGLFLMYLGERVLDRDKIRPILDGLGVAAALAGLVLLAARAQKSGSSEDKRAHLWLLGAGATALLGIGCYFAFKLGAASLRESLAKGYDRADALASLLFPALLLLGALPMIFMQRALQSMTDGDGYAEAVELSRVRYSGQSGVTLALVLIFCFAVNYIGAERNTKVDLARFRSTRPSEATRKVIQNLSRPIKATLFFPNPNEVREQIVPYFDDLSKLSPSFTYEVLDHALEPNRARDVSASGNGLIVLSSLDDKGQSSQRETVNIGTNIDLAHNALATFDGDVQKKLLTLTRPGRIAYFTTGHGERGFDLGADFNPMAEDLRAPVGSLRTLLQRLGYEVRTLGVGQGLGQKVPGDAALVLITGATEKFLPEEVSTLVDYLNQGGHVFVALDPSAAQTAADLAPVLKVGGVKYNPQVLCNDDVYLVRTRKSSDKANVVSQSFSSHVSVTTLARNAGRASVVLPKTGWFERDGAAPAGVQTDFTLRSMPKTYADTNANFALDSGEKQQVFEVAAAIQKPLTEAGKDAKSKKEMRMGLIGSVDAVSDLGMSAQANIVLMHDTIKWLTQDEALVGEMPQEQDLPIQHTKDQDKVWFYSTILAAPLLVLGLGLTYTRRVRRRRAS